ncbi:MAG: hypothetical protein AAGK05_17925, partial [Pseudomonadota bacterium]
MDGQLSLVSQEGKGSEFTVAIPVTVSDAEASAEQSTDKPTLHGISVLIVEDNPVNRLTGLS